MITYMEIAVFKRILTKTIIIGDFGCNYWYANL